MLLPRCRTCDKCNCACGRLPSVITVTVTGAGQDAREMICPLSFSSKFGSGAQGYATNPGGIPYPAPDTWKIYCTEACDGLGCDNGIFYQLRTGKSVDAGPLSGIRLSSGGSCYAKFGRVAPSLTASGVGTGAVFQVQTTASQDANGFAYWAVSSISVSGGQGYADNSAVVITADGRDTVETAAVARVRTQRTEPTVELVMYSPSAPGTGAVLRPVLTMVPAGEACDIGVTWRLDSVEILSPGSGYVAGVSANSVFIPRAVTGQQSDSEWCPSYGNARITSVDSNGGIVSIRVTTPAYFYAETVSHVEVLNGGKYYRESRDAIPYVSNVAVSLGCCTGTQPSISATVDSNPYSESFGKVVSLNIDSPGSDCLAWQWRYASGNPCSTRATALVQNGTHLLRANTLIPATVARVVSCLGSGACISLYPPPGVITGDPVSIGIAEPTGLSQFSPQTAYGSGYARVARVQPSVTITGAGTGAIFTCSLRQLAGECGLPVWAIDTVAVTVPGDVTPIGYENAEILSVATSGSGNFVVSGATLRLTVDDGVPVSVEVVNGGVYYREDKTLPPYVDASVVIEQISPSNGTGAVIVPSVDTNPYSSTFGQILSYAISSGGSGYVLYIAGGACTFGNIATMNGIFIAYMGGPVPLLMSSVSDQFGRYQQLQAVWEGTEAIGNCSSFSASLAAVAPHTGSCTIVPGGTYTQNPLP